MHPSLISCLLLAIQESRALAIDPSRYRLDGHHNHLEQVQLWLNFIYQIILHEDGVCDPKSISLKVWEYLVQNPVFSSDQETGLRWFTKVCIYFKMKTSLLLSSHTTACSLV